MSVAFVILILLLMFNEELKVLPQLCDIDEKGAWGEWNFCPKFNPKIN